MKLKHIIIVIIALLAAASLMGFFYLENMEEVQEIETGKPVTAPIAEDANAFAD